ncbi:hypothetical protein [Paracoccus rhizosphaerae]|uniref:Exopolysaccharide production repressor protein n=1 Tax=Paracoccus rhizosphaerae TaxID=1133347 RepID=A0ABV6CSP4_9RHOB|nr:hypothetical protein [Paracoccus rhizosphaerae]
MFVLLYLIAVGATSILIALLGIFDGLSFWTILTQLAILLVAAQVLVVGYVALQATWSKRDVARRRAGRSGRNGAAKAGRRWAKVPSANTAGHRH